MIREFKAEIESCEECHCFVSASGDFPDFCSVLCSVVYYDSSDLSGIFYFREC